MDRYDVDCVGIGAGVVGLAVARRFAMAGLEVMILEKNRAIGEETSSRNSEVIHAGIYYDAGSLKGSLCVAGKRALYDYCAARGVAHRRVTKLVVAADDGEIPRLEAVVAKAAGNGVDDLTPLDRAQTLRLEPALDVAAALLSPSTGVIDSHAYMLALLGDAEAHGAQLALGAAVEGGELLGDGRIALRVGGDAPVVLVARHVINAAGLWAQRVARAIEGLDHRATPPLKLAKGCYFALAGRSPFGRLIYPTPGGGGLGVHLTLDMGGRAKLGPDVEWLSHDDPAAIDYAVPAARADSFYAAIRRYWPGLPDGALQPDYSGVRPKLAEAGGQNIDFRIDGAEMHGAPGHVMLYGIESPGLTASLAIAERVWAAARDAAWSSATAAQ
jgi:L-2-hydroxyglutarate oxidase LhgO